MARRTLNGTAFSDRINAAGLAAGDFARSLLGDGNDVFEGSAGGDQAWGDAGNDALFGRAGHDSLVGGDGNDTLDGGTGNDTLDGGAGNDILEGGEGDDSLRGGAGNNRINAGGGNDRVSAGDDGDMIWGGTGNDTINAGGGNNWVYAGEGNDRVTAGDGGDMIWGDGGHDTISAGGGNNWVRGGEGDDRITAGDGGDMLYGEAGNDSIVAGNGNNWAYGGEGRDTILGGADNDMLFGEAGDDVLTDLGGNNRVEGGAGNDRVTLGDGDDQVAGDIGNDTVDAGGGRNVLAGGAGDDSLSSGAGQDQLDGGEGNDTLRAGAGQDLVQGGTGDDLILQGRGDGAPGQDMLRGGAGLDTLRFEFTRAEWFNGANQVELARLVAAHGTPAAQAGGVVASSLFGLNFAEIEALSVAVDGTILTAADDAVTARNDTYTLLEGESLSRSVVSNDTVPDLIASVVLVGAAPSPGSFSLSSAGMLSFNTGTSFEHLAAGQVATLRFNYRVTDADGDRDDARVTLRITGVNDAASISGTSTGSLTEDINLTTSNTLSVADVDAGEAFFATPATLTGTYGTFTFNATSGLWGYALNNAAAEVQALNAGQSVTDTLTVTSLDGTASRTITVSIAGRNDTASISGSSTGTVAEDGTLTASGTLSVADVDAGQAVFAMPATLAGTYGSFTFNATSGAWTYALSNAAANVQALAQGQAVTDTLTVTSLDGTASQAITISITGANDGPVGLGDSNAATNAVLEGAANGSATGVTMRATDAEGDALTYSFRVGGLASAIDASGAFAIDASTGVITVANGGLLNFEAGATRTLTVFARDALGAESSAQVVISLTDRDETPATAAILSFDDVPGGALGDGGERPLTDYAGFTFSQAGIYNPDGALGYTTSSGTTLAFFAEARNNEVPGYPGVAGSPLVIARTDGTDFDFYSADFSSAFASSLPVTARAYDDGALVGEVTINVPNGAAPNFDFGGQYPGQRFTSIDRLEFSASDYFGLDDFAYGNVTAIIGGDVTAAVAEDGTLTASGALTITDPDPGQAGFGTPASLAGTYGSFTFNASSGLWGYTLNNAAANVQALSAAQSVTDTLTVASLDGTATRVITVSIAGANDAASIGGTTTGIVAEDGTLTASGTLTITDVDSGQASFAMPASLAGIYGSFTFDASSGLWGYALNNAAANVQALLGGQSVTDTLTVASLDGSASRAITVTVLGRSDLASIDGTGTGSVAEDGTLTAGGTLIVLDADADQARFATPASLAGTYGSFAFDAISGVWGYTLNNAAANVQTLALGQSVTDRLTVAALDGSAVAVISVSIAGANDAASISGPNTGSVAEDGTLTASGTLTITDVDSGEASFATPASLAGTYGSFTFNATSGAWGYTLNNAATNVQALNAAQTVTDTLTVASLDGSATRVITVSIAGSDEGPQRIDVARLAPSQGFMIQGDNAQDNAGWSVSTAGDVNGDGFADMIVGAPRGSDGGDAAGEAYVLFGGAGGFGAVLGGRQVVDLTTLTAAQGFIIQGDEMFDLTGCSVSSAGDVNGDGFADLIVGAYRSIYGAYGYGAGAAYVLFGGAGGFGTPDSGGRQVVDLTTLAAAQGFKIRNDTTSQMVGYSVSTAGDVNGDGFADLIVGARGGNGGGSFAGEAYVLFGGAGGFGTPDAGGRRALDLSTLTAAQGFIIQGDTTGDEAGRRVSTAGDVNGDGFADLIVGAHRGDDAGNSAGEAYVVFGRAGGFGTPDAGGRQVVDLTTLTAAQGFIIQGDSEFDYAGFSVSTAGDVNGDGFADLILGAIYGDDGGPNAGEAYVVFGGAGGFGTPDAGGRQVVDLTTLDATQGFIIQGDRAGDWAGLSVSTAGDVNGDGLADLIVGALRGTAPSEQFGEAYVVFGGAEAFGTADAGGRQVVDLSTLTAAQGFIVTGGAAYERLGYSVSTAGDVNGDGFDDLIVGLPLGSDGGYVAGEAYVLFGGAFGGSSTPVNTAGTSAAEILRGGAGNDSLSGGGGADVLRGGAGNDRLGVADSAFRSVDGGTGTDTLALTGSGQVLDLTVNPMPRLASIERFDLTGTGDNTLVLDRLAVLGLTEARTAGVAVIRVDGNAGDTVRFTEAQWSNHGSVTEGGVTYARLVSTDGSAEVQVAAAVGVGFPGGNTTHRFDLTTLPPPQGFIIQGNVAFDQAGSSVSTAGDVNGDGFADLIVGAPFGDDGGSFAGEVYVVFGGAEGVGTAVGGRQVTDLTTLTAAQGFIIRGDSSAEQAGFSVSTAGDVNGDGFADLIVGAPYGYDGGIDAGEAYVLFGGAGGFGTAMGDRQVINLAALNAEQGFIIQGDTQNDQAGWSVSTAGDVNGDGFADLIVGAPRGRDGGVYAGEAYVLFGGAGGFGTPITPLLDTRQVIDLTTLTTAQGFIIQGDADGGNAGRSVSTAGDVNGDGFADLIVGARRGGDGSSNAGEAYVVFGGAGSFGMEVSGRQVLVLTALTAAQGFIIQGDAAGDEAGWSVSSGGDVNGDGFADLIVGAPLGNDGGTIAGEAYVVFGGAGGFGTAVSGQQVVDLTTLTAAQGFIIQGDTEFDMAGRAVSTAGDVNGDGFADLIVGAPFGNDGGAIAGEAYVVFGGAGGFGTAIGGRQVVDLTTLTAPQGFIIQGDAAGDYAGRSVSTAGDVNGDGFADLIVGALGGDDGGTVAGEAYVLFGGAFGGGSAPVTTNGTSAAEILRGGAGNDSLSGGGGADVLRGGAGNDRLGVADSAFRSVDGGLGTDTLALTGSGQILDLTTIGATRITAIERFDLTGTGNNTLVLRPDDVFALSGTADAAWNFSALPAALVVDGNAGDTLDLQDFDPDGAGPALDRIWVKVLEDVTLSGAAGGAYDVWELQAGASKLAAIAAHNDLNIL